MLDDTDRLTGLPSRAAFMQRLAQADFDRDSLAVAVFSIARFASISRRSGPDAADQLLRQLADALSGCQSATTTVAHLGADEFAVLTLEPASTSGTQWISPIMTLVRGAVRSWFDDRPHQLEDEMPTVHVGFAFGHSRCVWTHALEGLAEAASNHSNHVVDASDVLTTSLEAQLRSGDLAFRVQDIGLVGRRSQGWRWLRLSAAIAEEALETADLDLVLGRAVERKLLAAAAKLVRSVSEPCRVTVPLPVEFATARSLGQTVLPMLERSRIPPSRLAIELPASYLRRPGTAKLVGEANAVGLCIVFSDVTADWEVWSQLAALDAGYIKVASGLTKAALDGLAGARQCLMSLAAEAERIEAVIILPAPHGDTDNGELAAFGGTYVEGAAYALGTSPTHRAEQRVPSLHIVGS